MAFCLTKPLQEKFLAKVKDGTINPEELAMMSSAARRAFFAKIIGLDNAKQVNALFESKLLLKSQKRGMVNWVKQLTDIKPAIKQDLLTKIGKWDKILNPADKEAFLADLAEQRVGAAITVEQAEKVFKMSDIVKETKAQIPKDSPIGSPERIKYGTAYATYKNYVSALRLKEPDVIKMTKQGDIRGIINEISGAAKSMKASMDNSFFGRQGIKVLFTDPDIWTRNFLKSWKDIGNEIKGVDAKLPVQADIYSRPNAINGNYEKIGLDVGVGFEEAFPSSLPERIPGLGRLYKASESAYNNAALRMRADIGDRAIAMAETQGVNLNDPEQAKPLGKLLNAMTGRGDIGPGTGRVLGMDINSLFFSIRFWKSNWDVLTIPVRAKNMPPFTRKLAAQNLLKIISSIAGILIIAEQLNPGSVELDPRSSDFGKIKIGKNKFDVTGGLANVAKMISRFYVEKRNDEWGMWTKTGSGYYRNMWKKEYGSQSALDMFEQYWEGKLSPSAGVVRDILEQEHYDGSTPTLSSIIKGLTVPISVEQLTEMLQDPNADYITLSMTLEALGFSLSTPFNDKWYPEDSKEKQKFYDEFGEKTFIELNAKYNLRVYEAVEELKKTKEYQEMLDEEKKKEITNVRRDIKDQLFNEYNFKPKYD